MAPLRQPSLLSYCACKALVNLLCRNGKTSGLKSKEFEVLFRLMLVLPDSLYNIWAERFLRELERRKITSDIQYLPISRKLTAVNVDDFPKPNVQTLCLCLMENPPVGIFNCKYESFLWNASELKLVERCITSMQKLHTLILHHVNLKSNPGFLKNIGERCENLRILDLSYGNIPQTELRAIHSCFRSLKSLTLLQKTSVSPCLNTVEQSIEILTNLKGLTFFEDGASEWSAILPAFHRLSTQLYAGDCALIEILAVHKILPVNPSLVKSVKVLTLHEKVLQQPLQSVASWVQSSFPSFKALRLHLNHVPLTVLESFLRFRTFNITEIILFINVEVIKYVQVLRNLSPNLSRLRISNENPSLPIPRESNWEEVSNHELAMRSAFVNLEYLSFSGHWDGKLAQLLLAGSTNLCNVFLKVDFFPTNLSAINSFPNLNYLTIDHSLVNWRYFSSSTLDAEANFLSGIASSARLLKRLSLKRMPSNEKDLLLRSLTNLSANLEII